MDESSRLPYKLIKGNLQKTTIPAKRLASRWAFLMHPLLIGSLKPSVCILLSRVDMLVGAGSGMRLRGARAFLLRRLLHEKGDSCPCAQ
ncbi:uncharacterized protein SKDI_12G2690 [Saccharomyces kudriavzevii IFO 1802]|uniref:Uncharacterized protein n=1 Tax=Saccharomyces kudriavzevii (strain ATCC MYA-4449 / AS 2.2408 / CBS 8840 / NBRC 1802 / NCYC 2889) TaxID=226230 RepID=A0AA35NI28_SACK1|nr:uncharacterized protein SKDI_12G2690 [Saccharomyces kudriavzevii IFO 1802]CAI4046492.1 hypothetical protein SKDI_12G2690 [Saccharomyces kudriavzevii IFO 1802]